MAVNRILQAILILYGVFAMHARADDFVERCARLPQEFKVSVVFNDRAVMSNSTLNVQELNRMSGRPAGDTHSVYGLTRAKPDFRLRVTPRMVVADDRRICAMPEIAIELGFSEFVVYLARELADPCHQDIIRQHEQEHVNTWKSHLRASAQLLATALRREIGEARVYAAPNEAETGVRAWAEELVTPWFKRMLDSVTAAQASIDTAVSDGFVTSRLRTCGQVLRGGSR